MGEHPKGQRALCSLTPPRQTWQEKAAPKPRPLLRQTCLCHFMSHFTAFVRQREVVTVRGGQSSVLKQKAR